MKMKLTRNQLTRLIMEAMEEGRRIIVDPKGEAEIASDAYRAGTAKDAQTTDPRLVTLRQSGIPGIRQARDLATALEMQPDLTSGEETAVEMGKQKAMAPDLGFHNELSMLRSIELSKYLKRACQKRNLNCTVEDERDFDPEDPFIVVKVRDVMGNINASIQLSDSWMGSVNIEVYAEEYSIDPDFSMSASDTIPYYAQKRLEDLAEFILNSLRDSLSI
jgi:hypothetical protein